MKDVILFDLGNTLVKYFERSEFSEILKESITEVYNYLNLAGKVDLQGVWQRVKDEDHESKDYQVRPLEDRLARIFEFSKDFGSSDFGVKTKLAKDGQKSPLPPFSRGIVKFSHSEREIKGDFNCTQFSFPHKILNSKDFIMSLCRCFMKPIFNRSQIYDDTLQSLSELKSMWFRMAIISNTTWGSPAELWREEIKRFDLHKYVEFNVFCRDVGWRKPSEQIFEFTLKKMNVSPEQCIFIGDDPRWDVAGPKAVGIEAILIDRKKFQNTEEQRITNLHELCDMLKR